MGVLAVALDVPVHHLIKHYRLPRPIALLAVLLIAVVGGVLVMQLLLPQLINQFEQLTTLLPVLFSQVQALLSNQPLLGELARSLPDQFSWDRIQPFGAQLLGVAGGAANGLVQVMLMSLLAVLLVLDPSAHRRMVIAATPRPARASMEDVLDQCRTALGGWLAGMTLSALAMFLCTWAGLAVLGIPLALLSALVCGLLTFVPTIGPTAATLLPTGLALLQSPQRMVSVVVFRLILQNLEAFVLTPLLLRKTVKSKND